LEEQQEEGQEQQEEDEDYVEENSQENTKKVLYSPNIEIPNDSIWPQMSQMQPPVQQIPQMEPPMQQMPQMQPPMPQMSQMQSPMPHIQPPMSLMPPMPQNGQFLHQEGLNTQQQNIVLRQHDTNHNVDVTLHPQQSTKASTSHQEMPQTINNSNISFHQLQEDCLNPPFYESNIARFNPSQCANNA
jgi:hypothetical protein